MLEVQCCTPFTFAVFTVLEGWIYMVLSMLLLYMDMIPKKKKNSSSPVTKPFQTCTWSFNLFYFIIWFYLLRNKMLEVLKSGTVIISADFTPGSCLCLCIFSISQFFHQYNLCSSTSQFFQQYSLCSLGFLFCGCGIPSGGSQNMLKFCNWLQPTSCNKLFCRKTWNKISNLVFSPRFLQDKPQCSLTGQI